MMEQWQRMTPTARREISERVLLEIDEHSAPPTRHANLLDIYDGLSISLDVQAGIRKALESQGFITRFAAGVAQVTEAGAAHAADLRAKSAP